MPMSATTFTAVQALRAEQRLFSDSLMLPRLWQAVRSEWQRMQDRATARSVYRLGHEGVSEDFRTACQRR
jgi:hypothetical protein